MSNNVLFGSLGPITKDKGSRVLASSSSYSSIGMFPTDVPIDVVTPPRPLDRRATLVFSLFHTVPSLYLFLLYIVQILML